MSGFDLYEDGFPHGTREGFDRGCRGGACPAGIEHGLSCRQANIKSHGDYTYRSLVAAGKTPAEIAAQLHAAPIKHEAPKKRVVIPDDDTDDLEEVTEKEEPTMNAPTPADIAKKSPRKSPAGPTQSEVREWAHANGIDVNPRGSVRKEVVDAYLARDTSAVEPELSPVKETSERLNDEVEPAASWDAVSEVLALAPEAVDTPAIREEIDTVLEAVGIPPVMPHRRDVWMLPLTGSDLRTIADALDVIDGADANKLSTVVTRIDVIRPGGGDIIGHFTLADDFGDDPWFGFVPLGGAA